jgi:hypothetical protein
MSASCSERGIALLTAEEIEDGLKFGYEARGVELKGPGNRADRHFFARVARAALGMGNLRDGGHVIIGIADDDPASLLPGLEKDDLESWLAYDDVARKLGEYADPPLGFDIAQVELGSGASVAVIQVFEFGDLPHLCAKEYPDVLRKGALYVRPRKVPETSEIASHVEMRDIIDLAVEKGLRAFIGTADRAGLAITAGEGSPSKESDVERFKAEQDRAWD